jgi:general secretion pathway protein D
VLIPHIVREPDFDAASVKAIDVGTANSIQLRRITPLVAPTAAPAAPNQAPAAAPTTQNAAPAQAPQPAVSGGASFSFDPPSVTQANGSSFAVNILLSGAQNVYSVPLQVSYDPKLLQVANVSNGSFLSQDGQAVVLANRDDNTAGTLQITATRPPGVGGVTGQGAIVTLTFMAKAVGQGTLTISKGGARDPAMQAIPVMGAVASVTIQ